MKLKITQEYLDAAGYDADNCPIAQTLKGEGFTKVLVSKSIASYFYGGKKYIIILPEELTQFIYDWDNNKRPVFYPFEIEVFSILWEDYHAITG